MQISKLNLGCGHDIRPGYLNLDNAPLDGVDVVHDLTVLPLPFSDNEFEEILCKDVLEHLEYMPLMAELYRVLTPGGILHIQVPHFTSYNNFIDPTHRKRFSYRTFEFFVRDSKFDRGYYLEYPGFSELTQTRIIFQKGPLVYNHLVEPLVNSGRRMKSLYEATGMCYLFPAANVTYILKK